MGGDGRLNTSVNVGEAAEPGREELRPDSGWGEAGLEAWGGKWLGVVEVAAHEVTVLLRLVPEAWAVHSLRTHTQTEREVRSWTGSTTLWGSLQKRTKLRHSVDNHKTHYSVYKCGSKETTALSSQRESRNEPVRGNQMITRLSPVYSHLYRYKYNV